MAESNSHHWDGIYSSTPIDRLGWFEPHPEPSLQIINSCKLAKDAIILDAGSGATSLLAALIEQGYRNLYAVDISSAALALAQSALAKDGKSQVHWLKADLTQPLPENVPQVDLWHDRAVFHFLITEPTRQAYLDNLLAVLKPGGFLVLAAFAVGGASQCSGLPIHNYDSGELEQFFGENLVLLESMAHTYQMPSGGLRPYIYARLQRKGD